jgi:hypothetical protein
VIWGGFFREEDIDMNLPFFLELSFNFDDKWVPLTVFWEVEQN